MSITPTDLIGLKCAFDHAGKRLVGVVTAAKAGGFAEPGHIPDFLVTARGESGRELTVSMVNTHMSFPDR
jgi:hypothetical protein